MIQLDDKTFDPTLRVSSPMFVMFTATWAGPCNLARPDFEAVANRLGNQIIFAEFVIDENEKVPARYNVRALPCFMMFVDGTPTEMIAGAVGYDILMGACENA